MKKLCYTFLGLFIVTLLPAQTCRYLEEIFPSVKVTSNIVYGRNASVLEFPDSLQAIPKDLILDLYEPEGDNAVVPGVDYLFPFWQFFTYYS
jgi:hypothetical protein